MEGYAALVADARRAMTTDADLVRRAVTTRLDALVASERFEDAAAWRNRLAAFVRGAARAQRVGSLAGIAELVAARPTADHGWEVHAVRHGRLVGAVSVPPGVDPRPAVDAVLATAETVAEAPAPPRGAASVEETECVLRWLEQPGARLVRASGPWRSPVRGAAVWRACSTPPGRRAEDAGPRGRPRHRPTGMGGGPLAAGPTRIALTS